MTYAARSVAVTLRRMDGIRDGIRNVAVAVLVTAFGIGLMLLLVTVAGHVW